MCGRKSEYDWIIATVVVVARLLLDKTQFLKFKIDFELILIIRPELAKEPVSKC